MYIVYNFMKAWFLFLGLLALMVMPGDAELSPAANSLVNGRGAAEDLSVRYRALPNGQLSYFGSYYADSVPTGVGGEDRVGAAEAFVGAHGDAFGLDSDSLELKRVSDSDSSTFVRFRQLYNDLPVYGSGVNVQVNDKGNVQSVLTNTMVRTGSVAKVPFEFRPTLNEEDAEVFAEAAMEESLELTGLFVETGSELMVYSPKMLNQSGRIQLVWSMVVTHTIRRDIRHQVLLNAHTGEVALSFSLIHVARDREVYDSTNTNSDPGTLILTESSGTSTVPDVNDAFEYLGDTYDYFLDNHGRDSIDDAGYTLRATVRFCFDGFGCPMQNAFWDGTQMYFGEGFSAADDVVAHELVHGFTTFTSDLIYYSQSGAINEALSDIFGEFVDQANTGGTDTEGVRWKMGEDVPGFGAIRNMKDPTEFNDPDRRCSPLYYTGEGDNQGVHINSGVINKLAYLLVDGDTFNGHTIDSMGLPLVSDLFFYCQVNLLDESSDFTALYDAITQASIDLGYTEDQKNNIENACQAVEISRINPCIEEMENDDCSSAEVIIEGITSEGSNSSATTSTSNSCLGFDTFDAWYKITPNLSGYYDINCDSEFFDITLNVYDGCGGSILYCNDDIDLPGDNLNSAVIAYLEEGETYYIRIASHFGGTGSFNVNVKYQIEFGGNLNFDLNSNPGWAMEGGWSFGPASGNMGNPSTAFSGNNVLGYERSGEYGNSMDPEYLTTQSFNFEDFSDVQLKYRRFLGVEGYYDNASVEITNNGVDWHTIWSNSVNTYDDESWATEVIDISPIADNEPEVQIRWVMGETSSSVKSFGWNIDDIEFVTEEIEVVIIDSWVDFDYGGTSTGEEDLPFKHVMAAIQYAEEDGSSVIKIKGDSAQPDTTEIGMISKPLRIEAINGTVRLGDDSE